MARLPEQPGVYLYCNDARRDALRRQGALLRDRVAQLSRRLRHEPAPRRAARRSDAARSDRHRLGGRGAGAREQPDQAAVAALQHPAARRQELPVPAADDDRGVSARAGGAVGRAGRQLLRRPVPAGQVRAPDDGADAQDVRHPVVQRGDHRHARAAVPRVRHRAAAWRRASRRSAREERYAVAVADTRLFLEGRNEELAEQLRDAHDRGRGRRALRGGGAAARRDAHGRGGARAAAEDGDRRARRSRRVRRQARRRAARSCRCSCPRRPRDRARRVCRRGDAGRRERAARGSDGASGPRGWRCSRSTPIRSRRRRFTCRSAPTDSDVLEAWLSAARRPQGPHRRAAARRQEGHGGARAAQRGVHLSVALRPRRRPPITTRSSRCRRCCKLPTLPRRIECFDISTIQGSETVASMVVCEDGRMKRSSIASSAYVADSDRNGVGSPETSGDNWPPDAPATCAALPRRLRGHGAGRRPPLQAKVLEDGGPFPDLIVIDGGKGQLNAAYEALETRRAVEPRRDRPGEERGAGLHARQRRSRSRSIRTAPRCACCSGSATRRIASRSPSTASRARSRDLQSALDAIPGIGAAASQDAADALRQRQRRAARHARGADARRRRAGGARDHRPLRAGGLTLDRGCGTPQGALAGLDLPSSSCRSSS